jgi:hypothetical protein
VEHQNCCGNWLLGQSQKFYHESFSPIGNIPADKFIFSHDTSLSIGSLDDGAIESTWEAQCPSHKIHLTFSHRLWGFWAKNTFLGPKFIGEIEYGQGDEVDGIFEWGEFGKYFIFGTSEGGLKNFEIG